MEYGMADNNQYVRGKLNTVIPAKQRVVYKENTIVFYGCLYTLLK